MKNILISAVFVMAVVKTGKFWIIFLKFVFTEYQRTPKLIVAVKIDFPFCFFFMFKNKETLTPLWCYIIVFVLEPPTQQFPSLILLMWIA